MTSSIVLPYSRYWFRASTETSEGVGSNGKGSRIVGSGLLDEESHRAAVPPTQPVSRMGLVHAARDSASALARAGAIDTRGLGNLESFTGLSFRFVVADYHSDPPRKRWLLYDLSYRFGSIHTLFSSSILRVFSSQFLDSYLP